MRSVAVSVTTGDYGYVNSTIDFGLYNCIDTDVAAGLPEALITFTGDAKTDFTKSNGAWLYFKVCHRFEISVIGKQENKTKQNPKYIYYYF